MLIFFLSSWNQYFLDFVPCPQASGTLGSWYAYLLSLMDSPAGPERRCHSAPEKGCQQWFSAQNPEAPRGHISGEVNPRGNLELKYSSIKTFTHSANKIHSNWVES